jgi:hypothetical protein
MRFQFQPETPKAAKVAPRVAFRQLASAQDNTENAGTNYLKKRPSKHTRYLKKASGPQFMAGNDF